GENGSGDPGGGTVGQLEPRPTHAGGARMSEIEFRAAQVAEVSYPTRMVTVIVAPYETPTVINTPRGPFTEVVTRGAYDGVQRRSGRIRANRDHDWQRMAGRVTDLHPEREEGLIADVKIFKTALGEET